MQETSLKYLEQRGILRSLLIIAEKDRVKTTELLNELRKFGIGQDAMYSSIKNLEKLGLIRREVRDYPMTRYIIITEKGKKVAEELKRLEKMLEG
ncbi:MAG: hypothetical protein ACTSR0_05990 [Candidatus Asgardarchaeia archaeon]